MYFLVASSRLSVKKDKLGNYERNYFPSLSYCTDRRDGASRKEIPVSSKRKIRPKKAKKG